uniref:Uncharacterized protein n=1 Tax=Chromera velia CCMP2878 TaxID=1169474 RepID=A0A0G4FCS8_9ALVE|eukprot:Cvel_16393.t1-p1 / transcript=Cvel_16393.t1 / gene=Cvel_16393 / organism=Chromera_velia_CCMP2878 / gene_product=hypothetical protein / transcript_product=hypothetical protein / location=Cvel_scaffold1262:424-1386(-) / protein_length=321 / sequence_SO=supercontig / SO=protein_coding / is_pseudo=false
MERDGSRSERAFETDGALSSDQSPKPEVSQSSGEPSEAVPPPQAVSGDDHVPVEPQVGHIPDTRERDALPPNVDGREPPEDLECGGVFAVTAPEDVPASSSRDRETNQEPAPSDGFMRAESEADQLGREILPEVPGEGLTIAAAFLAHRPVAAVEMDAVLPRRVAPLDGLPPFDPGEQRSSTTSVAEGGGGGVKRSQSPEIGRLDSGISRLSSQLRRFGSGMSHFAAHYFAVKRIMERFEFKEAKRRPWLIAVLMFFNVVLLIARLLTTCVNIQYLVHSIVIFLDLFLFIIARNLRPPFQVRIQRERGGGKREAGLDGFSG